VSSTDGYVDVPGDCIHMPGNEFAKAGCLLCNPKPVVSDAPPASLRMGASRATTWAHASCIRNPSKVIEAQYGGTCPVCNDRIHEGDDIAPDE
jgi:hypothetical protein